jgi:hypothetical protein
MSHSKLDLHGNLLVTTFQLPSGLDFSTFSLKIDDTVECLSVINSQLAIMTQNQVYYEYNSTTGIVSQPSSAENAVVKTCDVEGTVSSNATECVMTITPLPWYICPCHENLWRYVVPSLVPPLWYAVGLSAPRSKET